MHATALLIAGFVFLQIPEEPPSPPAGSTLAPAEEQRFETHQGVFVLSRHTTEKETNNGIEVKQFDKIVTPHGKTLFAPLRILEIRSYGEEVYLVNRLGILRYDVLLDADAILPPERFKHVLREIYRAPRGYIIDIPFRWGERPYYVMYQLTAGRDNRGPKYKVFRGLLRCYVKTDHVMIQYLPYTDFSADTPCEITGVSGVEERLTLTLTEGAGEDATTVELGLTPDEDFIDPSTL